MYAKLFEKAREIIIKILVCFLLTICFLSLMHNLGIARDLAKAGIPVTATVTNDVQGSKAQRYPVIAYAGYTKKVTDGAISDKEVGESFAALYCKEEPRKVAIGEPGDGVWRIIYNNFSMQVLGFCGFLLLSLILCAARERKNAFQRPVQYVSYLPRQRR